MRSQIRAGQEESATLAARLDDLREAVAAESVRRGLATQIAAPAPAPAGVVPVEVVPPGGRSAVTVAAVVAGAPGLDAASPTQRAALVAALAQGTCVIDALTATVGSINRQTAAALVRGLGGC